MNYHSLEEIRKSFANAAKAFDNVEGEEKTYQILKDLSEKELSAGEMLEELKRIGDTKEYAPVLENFFYKKFQDLEELYKTEKEKDRLLDEFKKLAKEYEHMIKEKGLTYEADADDLIAIINDDANAKLRNITNEELKENINLMQERIDNLKGIRRTGTNLEDIPTDKYNKLSNTSDDDAINNLNDEFSKINEEAARKEINTDATLESLMQGYNAIAEKQGDSKLHIDIKYNDDNSVDVAFSLEGYDLKEETGEIIYSFKDAEYFNKNVLPELIENHVIDGIKEDDVLMENDDLTISNGYNEELSISGNGDISLETAELINEEMKKDKNKNKGIQRTRLPKPNINNKGYNNTGVYFILIFGAIIFIASIIYILVFKK